MVTRISIPETHEELWSLSLHKEKIRFTPFFLQRDGADRNFLSSVFKVSSEAYSENKAISSDTVILASARRLFVVHKDVCGRNPIRPAYSLKYFCLLN